MNIFSDPVTQFYDPSVVCSVCGELGHTKRSCRYTRAQDLSNMSHEDRTFWTYIHPRDRPEALVEGEEQEVPLVDHGLGEQPMDEGVHQDQQFMEERGDQEQQQAMDDEAGTYEESMSGSDQEDDPFSESSDYSDSQESDIDG